MNKRGMENMLFLMSSASPLLILALVWILMQKRNAKVRIGVMVAAVFLSLPFGLACVFLSQGLSFEIGRDHSPGIGVVFLPTMLAWLVSALIAAICIGWNVIQTVRKK